MIVDDGCCSGTCWLSCFRLFYYYRLLLRPRRRPVIDALINRGLLQEDSIIPCSTVRDPGLW